MNEILSESLFFGFALSLVSYWAGILIQQKVKHPLCNPLLLSMIFCILFLKLTDVTYETFNYGGKYINYLLTPTTVCLAVPLYRQFQVLKDNLAAVLTSILAGAVSCVLVVAGLAAVTRLDEALTLSLLPKSITTAIAMGVSEEIGGMPAITVMAVIMTGLFGNIIAQVLFKLLHIENPVAQGLACGTGAHAIGTAKAMELGEIQGAMSSLSVVVAGITTVAAVPIFIAVSGM
ncbi:MAG: LrgB family protein [Lachnospiraceae bacterium]|nr:LrgB family protein [Lachnospiraceae bacterium]